MDDSFLKPKKIIKNTVFSLSSRLIPLIISFISIPVIIKNIGEERFGIITIAWAFIGYFNFLDLGIGKALTKSISEKLAGGGKKEVSRIFSTGINLTLALGVFGGFLFYFLSKPLAVHILSIEPDLINEVLNGLSLLSIGIPFVILSGSLVGTLEAFHSFKQITNIQIFIGICTYTGLIIITFFSNNIAFLIAWLSLQKVLLISLLFRQCIRNLKLDYTFLLAKTKYIKYLFSFGGWITVSSVIAPLIDTIDRFVVGAKQNMTSLTYYSVPIDLIKRLGILPSSITLVLFPIFSRDLEEEDQQNTLLYENSFHLVLLASTVAMFLLIVTAKEILTLWIDAEFAANSAIILQIICIGGLYNFLARVPLIIIQGKGRPDITAKFHLLELPIYVVILFIMTNKYGITGATIATAIRMVLDFIFLHSYTVLKLKLKNNILPLLFGSVLPVFLAFQISSLQVAFLYKLLITLLSLIILCGIFWIFILQKRVKTFIINQLTALSNR